MYPIRPVLASVSVGHFIRLNFGLWPTVSSSMSDTADSFTYGEIKDAPGYDVSSSPPPSYSYEGQQPPLYSAAPPMNPPPKIEKTCTYQPNTGCESFLDISPQAASGTTQLIASSSVKDKTVRRAFVRKVLSILAVQLLFTFSVVCVFAFSGGEVVQTNLWAYLSSIIIFIMVAIALSCCKTFSRCHPWNTVGLVVVALSLSYMVGTIASFHSTTDVVITMGAMLAISVAMIAFTAQTYDFTVWYSALLILAVDVIMFGFLHVLLLLHH